jgi:homoserine dehydrogenase
MEALRIALLGGGTVGSAFYTLVLERLEDFRALGVEPRFLGVLVRDRTKPRPIPQELLHTEPFDLLEADLVVEALGGVEAPLKLLRPVLEAGIPVVTANKALLAEAWAELRPFAEEGLLYHEASVMAGTPALSLLETLRGSELLELHGILNGTTLYILQEMERGRTYGEALREAQRLGFAEADPTLDVEGIDAAHKLTLLARLFIDPAFPFQGVEARGITALTPEDLERARERGERVRLLASLYGEGGGGGPGWPRPASPRTTPWPRPRGTPYGCAPPPLGRSSSPALGPGAGPRPAASLRTSSASSPGPPATGPPPWPRGPWGRGAPSPRLDPRGRFPRA